MKNGKYSILIVEDQMIPTQLFEHFINSSNKYVLEKSIDCAVFDNPTEADIWIKRKHSGELNGIGTVTWNSQQKQRFEEKTEGKSSIPLQIIGLLKSHPMVPNKLKEALPKLNITNLQRLMSDPYVREHMGLSINNGILTSNIQVDEVVKGLEEVAKKYDYSKLPKDL